MSLLSEHRYSHWTEVFLKEVSLGVLQEKIRDCQQDIRRFEERHQCQLSEYQQKYQNLIDQDDESVEHQLECARHASELYHWECLAYQLRKFKEKLKTLIA